MEGVIYGLAAICLLLLISSAQFFQKFKETSDDYKKSRYKKNLTVIAVGNLFLVFLTVLLIILHILQ